MRSLNVKNYNALYGIFIGVEKFPLSKGLIKNLYHANEDAFELCNFFQTYCMRENISHHLNVLTDEDFLPAISLNGNVEKESATRTNILRKLTGYLKVAQPDDLLIVYISTHGEIDFNDYFFIPFDGEIDNILGTGISAQTLVQALSLASGRGIKVLMIVDTCYSGAIGFDVAKYKGAFSGLLSSSPVEYSYEYFDKEHGIFSSYVIKGLEGEAQKGGCVTLINLFDYVYTNVQKDTGKRQNPLLIGTMDYNFALVGEKPVNNTR